MTSEAQTRADRIDRQLARAGWAVHSRMVLTEHWLAGHKENSGREAAPADTCYGSEVLDYVLLDVHGRPLAIIEAKRTSRDPLEGERQASDYADRIRAVYGVDPFIFLANGDEIYFWHRRLYPPRRVSGFFTREDLERMAYLDQFHTPLSNAQVDAHIVDRGYQVEAVKTVADHMLRAQRRLLLVLATGTGKTRVAIKIDEELDDLRGQGVDHGQLGTLAMLEGNLAEAAERHRAALTLFQQLREPAVEAGGWHQLGMVFQEARQWDEAERHYREAARIREELGLFGGNDSVCATWNQLATLSMLAGKPGVAEMWYRKAIDGRRKTGDLLSTSRALHNLASLLLSQPGRLTEARQLAEEALAISKKLDPGAAEIWKTYNILAQIAEQEALGVPPSDGAGGEPVQAGTPNPAREYRRLARAAKRNFAGTRHELRRHAPLILATFTAAQDPMQQPVLDGVLKRYADTSWKEMVAAIHRIVAGERDEESLQEGQYGNGPIILDAILAGLADPSTLSDLLLPEESTTSGAE